MCHLKSGCALPPSFPMGNEGGAPMTCGVFAGAHYACGGTFWFTRNRLAGS